MIARIEQALAAAFAAANLHPPVLAEAMRWAVEGGGKRLRPQICLAAAQAVGGAAEAAMPCAVAIELLHSYTLVHDDLPAMDNDAVRRGKPSVWAKFGEANAILAGDALQALAFREAARVTRNSPEVLAALGRAAVGVVEGQVADLAAAKDLAGTHDGLCGALDFIYTHKTGDLFVAAAEMGGWAGGGTARDVAALADFAQHLGIAFQYEDDLLDAGDEAGFSSLPILGRAEVMRRIAEHTDAACTALAGLPGDTAFLMSLARQLVHRSS